MLATYTIHCPAVNTIKRNPHRILGYATVSPNRMANFLMWDSSTRCQKIEHLDSSSLYNNGAFNDFICDYQCKTKDNKTDYLMFAEYQRQPILQQCHYSNGQSDFCQGDVKQCYLQCQMISGQ